MDFNGFSISFEVFPQWVGTYRHNSLSKSFQPFSISKASKSLNLNVLNRDPVLDPGFHCPTHPPPFYLPLALSSHPLLPGGGLCCHAPVWRTKYWL